jgi:hypothetical protein
MIEKRPRTHTLGINVPLFIDNEKAYSKSELLGKLIRTALGTIRVTAYAHVADDVQVNLHEGDHSALFDTLRAVQNAVTTGCVSDEAATAEQCRRAWRICEDAIDKYEPLGGNDGGPATT